MKKALLFLLMIIPFLCITASAEEVKYENLITDETTIEEDFKLLNIDINDYYKPTKYNYQKWYVIGMSEAYNDMETYDIQTYFYLYNPCEYGTSNNYMSTVANLYLTYQLGEHGEEVKEYSVSKLEYNKEHLIYKVKGFSYSFKERAEIYITSIKHFNFYGEGITSDSSFKAVANHSKLNGLSVELSFNSTLIIEDYAVDIVEIISESSWNNTFGTLPILLSKSFQRGHAYFYNFNFPKDIKPDSIEYAKFVYNKTDYHKNTNGEIEVLKETKGEIHEYTPGTKSIQIDSKSCELEFQTFVLGNRIEKGEFGYLEFSEEDRKKYDVDCSILLDIFLDQYKTHKVYESLPGMIGGGMWVNRTETWYSELDKVEMLELHYKKDGIIYKCQIVNQPLDKDDFTNSNPQTPPSIWDKIWGYMVKFGEMVLEACNLHGAPELVKGLVGCGLSFLCLVVGIVVSIVLLPYLIKFLIWIITLPIRLVQKILSL